jgi:PAS domain S-box-containing protein
MAIDTIEAAEARYRGLLEASPDSVIVVDRAGLIVTSNLRASTQFGYEAGELVGQHVTTIIPWLRRAPPIGRPPCRR